MQDTTGSIFGRPAPLSPEPVAPLVVPPNATAELAPQPQPQVGTLPAPRNTNTGGTGGTTGAIFGTPTSSVAE